MTFFLIIVFLASSCSSNSYDLTIDNPSDIDIKVLVNNTSYPVYAFENKQVKMSPGNYVINTFLPNDSLLSSEQIIVKSDAMINPFHSTYVIFLDEFLSESGVSTLKRQNHEINGDLYQNVNFETRDDFFILKTWDYNVLEPWGSEEYYYFKKKINHSKIYRLQDLKQEFGFEMSDEIKSLNVGALDTLIGQTELKLKALEN
jgi:hypothetical protein